MKSPFIFILGLLLVSFTPPGETDFRKVFGEKYTWAESWLDQNDAVIKEYASAFDIPEEELKAIVFPELIRYNSFFNAIEIESLKFLYVKEGTDYADFSVGYFQMKPSFAERLEKDAINLLPVKYLAENGWSINNEDSEETRRARVKRLSNVRQQLLYLCAFYKICDKRFTSYPFKSPGDRVKLFATCYNAGYHRSLDSLLSFYSKKHFEGHNYSEVAVYYYVRRQT